MTHPSSLDLEAFACGEVSRPSVADHVHGCAACAAFVARLGSLAQAGPSAAEAEALITRALTATEQAAEPAMASREQGREAVGRPRDPGEPRGPRASASKRRAWLLASSVITPLAAAAAVLLMARSAPLPSPNVSSAPPRTTEGAGAGGSPSPPDHIQMAPLPSSGGPAEPETTFKGGMQIAVVRERGGEQARFASPVRVRPGDRLRIEVALDREQAILGAVLADDGSYLELMPKAVRGPGTHFSEKSAKIDAAPTYGTIIIGTPEAVARARATRQLDGVASLRVEWEGKP